MSFSEFELKRIEKELDKFLEKRRPPADIRNEVDINYRIDGQSITILEIRPNWRDPSIIHEMPLARTTYVKSKNIWKVFWQRADMDWHSYKPTPVVKSVEEFLQLVDADLHHCFFG
ncbi:MAG: DUF3024 domain-containing protein [Gammaproteobacteria bacterium]|jgi:hypothetical protein|nr:DUF3024 domain-containing protein [Gammaproteobacteria bacterium]